MKEQRQGPASLALSVALHVVLGAVLVRVLTLPMGVSSLFQRERGAVTPEERIHFVATPEYASVTNAGKSGGDGRAVAKRYAPAPPLVAPAAVPNAVPAAPAAAAATPETGGSGDVIGAGGPTRGVRPTYNDPRLWVPAAPPVVIPRTPAERLDSALSTRLRVYRDSMALATHVPTKAERGDWTMERNGKKYGIDQKYIHLGSFQLPTAALALLPLNRQANPQALERERAYNYMHDDIAFQAQRSMNMAEFRTAVKAIRERKERERAEAARSGVVAEQNR
ncbi:MAG TPA: hypothetical protein VFJ74_09390 [Gemmatimonadaceae bacterium]|nr:hypothetical protein [Gemmatimonadaceae bacterium]